MKRFLIILIFYFIFGNCSIFASDSLTLVEKKYQAAIGGAYHYGQNLPDFSFAQGIVDCGAFQSDYFSGYSIFAEVRYPLKANKIELGINLGYSQYSGKIFKDHSFPFYDRINDNLISINTESTLESEFQSISLNPFIAYNFLGKLNILFRPDISYIISNNYSQYEEIKSPQNAVFINYNEIKTQNRELSTGEFQSLNNLIFGISAGIESEVIPISKSIAAISRLMFEYQITDYLSDASWKKAGISLELALSYTKYNEPIVHYPVPATPPMPDLPDFTGSLPEPKLKIVDIIFSGQILKGKELLSTVPMITSIFFQQNSAIIDTNYIINSSERINLLKSDPIKAHYHILPEIAYLLNEKRNAKVYVKGYTSGIENEPEGIKLSNNRVDNVKKALLSLGVSENQIIEKSSILPPNPSNMAYPEGIEENQRVDLELDGASIRKYVDLVKFSRWKGNAKIITRSKFLANQNVKITNSISDNQLSRKLSDTIDIPLIFDTIADSLQLTYFLQTNKINAQHTKNLFLNDYTEETVEKSLENFRAILNFDYNSSEINDSNKQLLSQMIEKLPNGSKIKIYGSADELGTAERNRELSKERAMNTKEYIESYENKKFDISIDVNTDKFDETTSQGRFLNRSIIIKIDKK